MLIAASVAMSATARAQRAGPHERELADLIRAAGFDCPVVDTIEVAPTPQPGFDAFRPEIAVCRNGRRFLVARSGRRNVPPVVRELPVGL